jgi:hypothetical protein
VIANSDSISATIGTLDSEIHLAATSLYELLDFITGELPRWRDRPDRRSESSETSLTSQLCAHLNSAARRSRGWDFLQFRIEEPDERKRGRKIDLIPAPLAATVWVDGRRHVDFDALLPIECKRLPTPSDNERDAREYVFSSVNSTGGIQRFKRGQHGAAHKFGAMIAYVQERTCAFWEGQIGIWINGLIAASEAGWAPSDLLRMTRSDAANQFSVLTSRHSRQGGLPDIELRHLWVEMNAGRA